MPNSDHLLALMRAHECPDSTFLAALPPLVFDKACGSEILDANGKRYIDLCSGFGASSLGHASEAHRKHWIEWTQESWPAIIHGMGDVYPSRDKALLLAKMAELLPAPLSVGALALTGAQAIEIAVKTALQFTKQRGFIVFDHGYHGLDLGILALTWRRDFREPFQSWIQADQVVSIPYGCDQAMFDAAVKTLKARGHNLAGVIVEPIQGRSGMISPPNGWLETIAANTRREGGLMIHDEIFTGMGRTGKWLAASPVVPDLVCLGKALGGGYPISACYSTPEIMSSWPKNQGEAIHTGTFFGYPLSARMALVTIETIEDQQLLERVNWLGQKFLSELANALAGCKAIKQVRGKGFFVAIECREPLAGARLMDILRAKGIVALASGNQGEGLAITPAFNIPEELLMGVIKPIGEAINLL